VDKSAAYWMPRLLGVTIIILSAAPFAGFMWSLMALNVIAYTAAVLGLRAPSLGLLGIGMASTLDAPTRLLLLTGGLWRWNTLNYWLLFVIVLFSPLLLSFIARDLRGALLQANVLLLGVELIVSSDPAGGAQHLLGIISCLGLLVYFLRARRDQEIWYSLGVINGVLGSVGGLLFFLQVSNLPYVNPNAWAFFPLGALFTICLAMWVEQNSSRQAILILLASINGVWVFLSGSRGAQLNAAVCLVLLLTQLRSQSRRVIYLAAMCLIAVAISARFGDLESQSLTRMNKLLDSEETLASRTNGRSELAMGGWRIFLANPFGVGTGGFAPALATLDDRTGLDDFQSGKESQAHSGWIKVLAENGLAGVALLGAYTLSFAVTGWNRKRHGQLPIGLLVTATLGLAFLSTEFQQKGLWFLAAGATVLMGCNEAGRQRVFVERRRVWSR
jgi:hypothetical protein